MLTHPDSGFYDNGVDLQDPDLYAIAQRQLAGDPLLPLLAYTSETFQRLENEKIWTRDWVCIGTAAEIAATRRSDAIHDWTARSSCSAPA